jgi:hypothetical protein
MRILFIPTVAILTGIFVSGCSKSQIAANAHVQDLGVVRLKAQSPTPISLPGDVSFYCTAGRPEQLPQKVVLTMSLTKSHDGSIWLAMDNVPTPADYARLSVKHVEFPFQSGVVCEAKIGENAWVRFTPIQEPL